jgi:uncharacterized protein (TIGR00106 family)
MIVAEISVSVLGEGTSIGRFVRVAVEQLELSGLKTVSGPNCTSIEASNIDEILSAVKAAHLAVVAAGAKRVVTNRRQTRQTCNYGNKNQIRIPTIVISGFIILDCEFALLQNLRRLKAWNFRGGEDARENSSLSY